MNKNKKLMYKKVKIDYYFVDDACNLNSSYKNMEGIVVKETKKSIWISDGLLGAIKFKKDEVTIEELNDNFDAIGKVIKEMGLN